MSIMLPDHKKRPGLVKKYQKQLQMLTFLLWQETQQLLYGQSTTLCSLHDPQKGF